MTCAVRDTILPKGAGVRVNGIPIPRDVIAREVQHHPSHTPTEAWMAAAQSLVIRELLLQEARRIGIEAAPRSDDSGRRETEEEALVRGVVEQEVRTPEPDADVCRRYYEHNKKAFRSPAIYEVAHILFAARRDDAEAYERARQEACIVLEKLRADLSLFSEMAKAHSDCPSAAVCGNLGQITGGETTPEFEAAVVALAVGSITDAPVATRYGFHIIRLDRKIDECELPYQLVADRISDYLRESVMRRATAQYIARLVSRSDIAGISLLGTEAHRVN
jgi:peptidyl-prolyl cis-trans isomerase C